MRLQGKTAIITGGAQGLGKSMALGLAAEGAKVLIGDINFDNAEKTAREFAVMGYVVKAAYMNVVDKNQVELAVADVVSRWGKLDILINNAGVVGKTTIFDTTEEEIDRIMAINLKGLVFCCQAAAKTMVENKYGKIINLASTAGRIGGGLLGTSIYAASKGAVIALTKGYARELSPYGINVNAIAPGSVDTPLTTIGRTKEQLEESIRKIPLRRRGHADELAGAAVFLSSDESSFVTGQTIDVNGGIYMS